MSPQYIKRQITIDTKMAEVYRYAASGVNMEQNCNSHPHEDAERYQELEVLRLYYLEQATARENNAKINEQYLRDIEDH